MHLRGPLPWIVSLVSFAAGAATVYALLGDWPHRGTVPAAPAPVEPMFASAPAEPPGLP